MRKLELRKEVLAELSTEDLAVVVGAAGTRICLTDPCITEPVSHVKCTFTLAGDYCA